MNKQETLRKLIREQVRKELKEGKFVDLIIKLFFQGKIKKAIKDLQNDPDIQDKFRALEFAVEELKAATKRADDFRNSDAYAALAKQFGKNDEFTKKYGPKRSK